MTVINNRWDRVARSEVFARILVDDASADRHVLIGTNLEGLQKYVRDAVDEVLARREVVSAEDLQAGELGTQRALGRLAKELAFLKVPRPTSENFFDRLRALRPRRVAASCRSRKSSGARSPRRSRTVTRRSTSRRSAASCPRRSRR